MASELIRVGGVFGAKPAMGTRQALAAVVGEIDGVGDVRLVRPRIPGDARHRVFVVLDTHDVDRDRQINDILCQLDDVEFDLVPRAAASMVPSGARTILR